MPFMIVEYMICRRVDEFQNGRAVEVDYTIEKINADRITKDELKKKMRAMFMNEPDYTATYVCYGRAKRKWVFQNGI